MSARLRRTAIAALAAWLALAGSIACWPLGGSGIGWGIALVALAPLGVPLAGMARARRSAFALAPFMLAPALALAVTETLANPAARVRTAATLALILAAFAAAIAALRALPR